jgi:hypothetical protein
MLCGEEKSESALAVNALRRFQYFSVSLNFPQRLVDIWRFESSVKSKLIYIFAARCFIELSLRE